MDRRIWNTQIMRKHLVRNHPIKQIKVILLSACMLLVLGACASSTQSASAAMDTAVSEASVSKTQNSVTSQPESIAAGQAEEILPVSAAKGAEAFNLETKTVRLNSGYDMPVLGIGTYSLSDEVCASSVATSLKAGGRLIDTASIYGNEVGVGQGIRQSGVPREEVFVTTKLYMNQYADAAAAIDEALEKLGVEYIDLMLLHHPGDNDVEAYRAMEKAVEEGKIRSVGLSNWYAEELETFLPQVTITPAVIQNEIHPYYQENDVIPYLQEKGIVVEGWYPLGVVDTLRSCWVTKPFLQLQKHMVSPLHR